MKTVKVKEYFCDCGEQLVKYGEIDNNKFQQTSASDKVVQGNCVSCKTKHGFNIEGLKVVSMMKNTKILFIARESIQEYNLVIDFLKEKGYQVITVYSMLEIADIINGNPDIFLCLTKIVMNIADFDDQPRSIPDNLGGPGFLLTGLKIAEKIKNSYPELPIWAVEICNLGDHISEEEFKNAGIEEHFYLLQLEKEYPEKVLERLLSNIEEINVG